MSDVTSWDPASGADLVGSLNAEGQTAEDLGEQIIHSVTQLTGDGLLGASADGANQLAAAIHGTTQAMKDTANQVASHTSNYGENMTGIDSQYGASIAGQ
ncbi:hypothetical protein [Mycobacteroides abscessus]|uniref:hypothetical protein n=1 Tax=Mycobacteroides abscessus TaxID=36809 RepID=UPI00092C5318|nr:hypothetical protein [Mycobacteroides abscessus]SHQ50207.1 Uncharacterised protein [Mycobacteroides abscessus subsp. abscessus]SKQ83747.1 Uncharacterised protein [Mycobacteroides abscessus subsp. massiliense]SLC49822.1 Uncharacterised protein [Mycobacteroides abscessus subsp. massiliense]